MDKATRAKPRRMLPGPKGIVPALAGLLLVIGVVAIAYLNRTEEVVVSVSVKSPNGGVFADSQSCSPRSNFIPLLESIRVDETNNPGAIAIPESHWRLAEENVCVRDFVLELQPDKRYDISIGSSTLGVIDSTAFLTKRVDFLHVISVKQDLHGTFQLKQKADSCRQSSTEWSCTWYPIWQVSMKLNPKTYSCSGTGGYADIKRGASVKIYSSDDVLLATTAIANPTYELESVKSRVISCSFTWTLVDVPNDDKGYFVEIAKRGKVFFSTESLRLNGWAMNTELKD